MQEQEELYWRCRCGREYEHAVMFCSPCLKGRWEHLGIGYKQMCALVRALYAVDAEKVA